MFLNRTNPSSLPTCMRIVGLKCCNPEEVSPPICDKRVVEKFKFSLVTISKQRMGLFRPLR
jgi:hypothetical protein